MDFARARSIMVEGQVRTNDVTDAGLLHALRRIPRELFAPEPLKALAYSDLELEVAPGRKLLRPRELAKLLQAVAPRRGEKCLEIAGATGYGAAVLAGCGGIATLLEPAADLAATARAALDQAGFAQVRLAAQRLVEGSAGGGPYDAIILNGSAEFVPQAWLDQLAEGGRLGVIVRNGPAGSARIYTKSGGATSYRIAFDASAALVPELVGKRAFVF
jgi:protein-L-isoaspartate(D-aspartate) O-methyltransferase